jgi:4-hydroxyphenylpyruvate dioxygenase-like putative hemolysin
MQPVSVDPKKLPTKGMIVHLGHLCHSVKNLDAAVKMYEQLFQVKPTHQWELPDAGANSAWIPFGCWNTGIQVMEPTPSSKGPVAQAIEEMGEGVSHIVLMADDTAAMVESLKSKGVDVVESTVGGKPDAWVPRKYLNGMLYQIISAKDYYSFFKWGKL